MAAMSGAKRSEVLVAALGMERPADWPEVGEEEEGEDDDDDEEGGGGDEERAHVGRELGLGWPDRRSRPPLGVSRRHRQRVFSSAARR